jgi:PilZ domain
MLAPDDPRFDELQDLSAQALGAGFTSSQRARWRELTTALLGTLHGAGRAHAERRQGLRGVASLQVDVLEPAGLRGTRLTSTVSAGGLSIPVPAAPPPGTLVDLAITVSGRADPLRTRAAVAWASGGDIGVAFIDLLQGERELLEAVAVQALLVFRALE